jgi:hypothetical protein
VIEILLEPQQLAAKRACEMKIRFTNAGPGVCTDVVFKLDLPPGFFLLDGRDQIRIPKLRPGTPWEQAVTVRAMAVGDFTVTSGNFSYRNEYGTPVRVRDYRARLTVTPALPEPSRALPDLDVTLANGVLAPDEWDMLRIRVRNASQSPLRGITLRVSGPVRIAPPGPDAKLPELAAGQETEVTFIACPTEMGSSVPAQVHLTYHDGSGARTQNGIVPLTVRRLPAEADPAALRGTAARQDTILFLAASPQQLPGLRSDLEMREIREQLRLGKLRERFRLESAVAARLRDIGQALADYDPRIVHFSGHGSQDGSLYVEDGEGYGRPAAPEGLAGLFRLHAKTIDCVIVNACHSLRLAEAMTHYIDYVIATRTTLLDTAAIHFSMGFYQGLAYGAPVPDAFERGISFLKSTSTELDENTTPILLGHKTAP